MLPRSILTLMKLCIVAILLISCCHTVLGQCKEWKWPQDKKTAEEKIAILQDAVKTKRYKAAIPPLNWLIANAPQLNSSIYIHGASIYDGLATAEKDPTKKQKYVDSLLLIYDMRIRQCGDVANVMSRKASTAFKYLINSPQYGRILPIMDTVFMKYPEEVSDGQLLSYMQTIVVTRQKSKAPDDNAILQRFDLINGLIAERLKSSAGDQKRIARLTKTKKDVEQWLFRVIKPDCDFVKNKLAPAFKKNPSDIETAKRIFAFMLEGKCTDDPVWLQAAAVIFRKEKDFGLAKNIALRYLSDKVFKIAESYMDSTLALATTARDSSEAYYYKGVIASAKEDKPAARSAFLKSLSLDKTRTEAAERIGDLYYGSFKECAQMKVQADDRAVYLAAYTWYARAGNEKKMQNAKALFPSREEIFLVNRKKGDKVMVGCWINEEVVIQTRD